MAKEAEQIYKIDGISVVIGEAISKDSGLVPVAREIRRSGWFKQLLDELPANFAARGKRAHGFGSRAKLDAGLVTLISGLVLGR